MQIGIAQFRDGAMAEEWKSYINPEDYFDSINTSVHGIDDTTVKDAPILAEVADRMYTSLGGHVALCHAHFDRVALAQAFEKYGVRPPSCTWLDSARVARRTWAGFAWRGYGLANVCFALGYRFTHHDALEDAKAAAWVLLAAVEKTKLSIHEWLRRVELPIDPSSTSGRVARDGNPDGLLYGETVVFTGALEMSRCEAARIAALLD